VRREAAFAVAFSMLPLAGCGYSANTELSDAQQAIVAMKIAPSDLKIVADVDRADRRYRVGDKIGLTVQVDRPASVAVLRVLRNGVTTLVFPNKAQPDAKVAANTALRIPEAGVVIAAERPGTELFEFIASTGTASWLFTRKPAGDDAFVQLGATTRAVAKDIVGSLKAGPSNQAAAMHLSVRVSD